MKSRRSILFLTAPLFVTSALVAAGIHTGHHAAVHTVAINQPKIVSLTANNTVATTDHMSSDIDAVAAVAEHSKSHHPEVKLFGRPIGVLAQFGVTVFNFLLFFGILFFALKGALSSAFKTQREELKAKLFKSEQDKEEANRQVQELEARMFGLQQELSSVMAKAEIDAKIEQNQILEAAKTEVAQIMHQTHVEIESLKQSAKSELHAMVMDLVIANAAERLTAQLHGNLAAHTLDQAIEKVRGNK